MSDDINLDGIVLKRDTGVQDLVKWVGYLLILVGIVSGFAMPGVLVNHAAELVAVLGFIGTLTFVASGALFLVLAKIIELLREIRDANHTIVD